MINTTESTLKNTCWKEICDPAEMETISQDLFHKTTPPPLIYKNNVYNINAIKIKIGQTTHIYTHGWLKICHRCISMFPNLTGTLERFVLKKCCTSLGKDAIFNYVCTCTIVK